VRLLQGKLQSAAEIETYIKQREQQLKNELFQYGLGKQLTGINKEAYYYQQQLVEFKNMLNDETKMEKALLKTVRQIPAFQNFWKKYSILASLFSMPADDPNDPSYLQSLEGLQSKAQVGQLIQSQIEAGGPDALRQMQSNMVDARSQLNQLKDKMSQYGSNSADGTLPDFKPNSQKTKSLASRIV
jgi:hypothetical protein